MFVTQVTNIICQSCSPHPSIEGHEGLYSPHGDYIVILEVYAIYNHYFHLHYFQIHTQIPRLTFVSAGLTYSTVSLFSTVIFLIVATHMNGWKLDKKYGVVLMFWYLIFMIFASLYELNVFGYLNPPECPSPY